MGVSVKYCGLLVYTNVKEQVQADYPCVVGVGWCMEACIHKVTSTDQNMDKTSEHIVLTVSALYYACAKLQSFDSNTW